MTVYLWYKKQRRIVRYSHKKVTCSDALKVYTQ